MQLHKRIDSLPTASSCQAHSRHTAQETTTRWGTAPSQLKYHWLHLCVGNKKRSPLQRNFIPHHFDQPSFSSTSTVPTSGRPVTVLRSNRGPAKPGGQHPRQASKSSWVPARADPGERPLHHWSILHPRSQEQVFPKAHTQSAIVAYRLTTCAEIAGPLASTVLTTSATITDPLYWGACAGNETPASI